jgi:cytochrome P450
MALRREHATLPIPHVCVLLQFFDLFGKGIFNSNGATWRAHREFAKSLFTPDHLRSALPVFERYAERMLHQWDTLAVKTIDVQDYFMRYTVRRLLAPHLSSSSSCLRML